MCKYCFYILLFFAFKLNSQTHPPAEKSQKQVPKNKILRDLPKGDYTTSTLKFKTKDKRIEYMRANFATNCLAGSVYSNGFKRINYSAELAEIDSNYANNGLLVTIKMSDNSLFVFMFHYLCNFNGVPNGFVNVTYFNFKFGEIDKLSSTSFNVKVKRLYPKNNVYTEELICGKAKFIIENNADKIKLVIPNKEIQLEHQVF